MQQRTITLHHQSGQLECIWTRFGLQLDLIIVETVFQIKLLDKAD